MKSSLVVFGILSGVFAYLIAQSRRRPAAVDDLAHQLEAAWADHHTVA